jgi:UDP-3-O-[3-hydroxymyristoyl] glucosamine N-acyltransferase
VTVQELAQAILCSFEGEAERRILTAAPLESAAAADLSFAASAKSFAIAQLSQAGCLIVPADYVNPSQTLIRSSSPRHAFAQALALLFPPAIPAGIHPSAVVAPDFSLQPQVSIGPHCTIGRGVTIGTGSTLHANVTIYDRVHIGCNAILHAGAVIGADGFGFALDEHRYYRKFPQVGTVEIGDDVEIGANTCIDRAALGVTRIGNGVKLDNQVHIGHNCQIGNHVVIAAQTGLSGGVTVGDHAIIGGQVGIGDKARIEAGAIVGSGSGILTSKIVRAGEPVWGTPARPLREYLKSLATLSRLARAKSRDSA